MKFPSSVLLSLYTLSVFPRDNGSALLVSGFVPQQFTFPVSSSRISSPAISTTTTTTITIPRESRTARFDSAVVNGAEGKTTVVVETEGYKVETTERGPNVPGPVHTLTFHSIPGQADDVPPLVLETGKIGRQAAGAVELTRGDTVLYSTCARDPGPKEDINFLPLSVEHQERFSSAGMTSGSYNKRDGRPAEHEILTCRLIDRPLRPLITKGWSHETQLLNWVLSYDGVRSCDPLAITASAAALYISDVPLTKPVAAVMVGYIDEKFVINPSNVEMEKSRLQLVVAGTKDGIMMIEGAADFLPESIMIDAVKFGHDGIKSLCDGIEAYGKVIGVEKKLDTIKPPVEGLQEKVDELMTDKVDEMYAARGTKKEVGKLMWELQNEAQATLEEYFPEEPIAVGNAFKDLLCRRMFVLGKEKGLRCDGRKLDEIRPLDMETGHLPRVHGSALFTRGETQAIATATLGGSGMRQKIDNIAGTKEKRFYLQYTFPPSCVGETGRVGMPGRREVGHGNLAERYVLLLLVSSFFSPVCIGKSRLTLFSLSQCFVSHATIRRRLSLYHSFGVINHRIPWLQFNGQCLWRIFGPDGRWSSREKRRGRNSDGTFGGRSHEGRGGRQCYHFNRYSRDRGCPRNNGFQGCRG